MVSHGSSSSSSGGGIKGNRQPTTGSPGTQGMKKGPWTTTEDGILTEYVNRYGEGNWNAVQRNSGLQRCGKSCRLRWANHLRPNLKKGAFSPDEERLILELHAKLGNKWARMASQLSGRTDNEIKNYWNTRVKRLQRAGLPIYPDSVHTQTHNSSPPSTTASFGINPSFSAFFTATNGGNYQTLTPHPFHNPPQFTIFHNPNPIPLQYPHQKSDLDPLIPTPTTPFQFNFNQINHPNSFTTTQEPELPSIQSTPVSSSDNLISPTSPADYQYYDDIATNSGLLEALLEESKALLNKQNSSDNHHHDPSPDQSSISLNNDKDILEETNDLSSFLNNFPLTMLVPNWYDDEDVKNPNKHSFSISNVSSGNINNLQEDSKIIPAINITSTSKEDDCSTGFNPYCWNNIPRIC